MSYRLHEATLADADVLVHHRLAMFSDMGEPFDRAALDASFRAWLETMMTAGMYRAWLVEAAEGEIVAGGGMTLIPWPPSPRNLGHKIAFVYNVYTEPAHRRHGLARMIMEAVHEACARDGIFTVALHASQDGQPLYASMGYQSWPTPMLFLPIVRV